MSTPPPPRSAIHLSLGVAHIGSVLDKLRWEIRQHIELSGVHHIGPRGADIEARGAIFAAINAAGTAWSLIEWAEHDLEAEGRPDALRTFAGLPATADIKKIKNAIRRSSDTINHCFHIAHAAKHARLSRMDPGISAEALLDFYTHEGELSTHLHGVVSVESGDVSALMTVRTVIVDALLWGEHFARVLGLRTRQ